MSVYDYNGTLWESTDDSYDPGQSAWNRPADYDPSKYSAGGNIYTYGMPTNYQGLIDRLDPQVKNNAYGFPMNGAGGWEGIYSTGGDEQNAPVLQIPNNVTDAARMDANMALRGNLTAQDIRKYFPQYASQIPSNMLNAQIMNLQQPDWWKNPQIGFQMEESNDFSDILSAAMQIAPMAMGISNFAGGNLFGDFFNSLGFGDGGLGSLFGGGGEMFGPGLEFAPWNNTGAIFGPGIEYAPWNSGGEIFGPGLEYAPWNNTGEIFGPPQDLMTPPEGGFMGNDFNIPDLQSQADLFDWMQGYSESLTPNTQYLQDLMSEYNTPQFTMDQVIPQETFPASDITGYSEGGALPASEAVPSNSFGVNNNSVVDKLINRAKNMGVKDYMKLGEGVYKGFSNTQRAGDMRDLLDMYSNKVDPFGSQRGMYQRRLNDLYTPQGMQQAFQDYMSGAGGIAMEQLRRRDAAQGRRSQAGALQSQLQKQFNADLLNQKQLLGNLSGAQFGPGALVGLAQTLGPRTSDAGAWSPMFGALGSIFGSGGGQPTGNNGGDGIFSTLLDLFN